RSTVTIRLAVTIAATAVRRLPVPATGTKAPALPTTFTRSTVTIRLAVTIAATAVRLAVTFTRRTVPERLTIAVAGGRTVPLGAPVIPGTVPAGIAAGVVGAAETTAA
ncbi:hypothetical protein, partial [Pseudarthrobacter sp. PvP090]|uniref:hypothetical protein n=1 Tax=Pseudarthrobacter sp. PvP090 TaxID=3156393 RepID=UPI003394F185